MAVAPRQVLLRTALARPGTAHLRHGLKAAPTVIWLFLCPLNVRTHLRNGTRGTHEAAERPSRRRWWRALECPRCLTGTRARPRA